MEVLAHPWLSLCVFSFVAQAPFIHGFSFDLLSLFQDLFSAPKVDISGRQVPQALMVSVVVVVSDEVIDLHLEITGQEVVLQQDAVLHGLMPAFNLALGLWVEWCATNVIHALVFKVFGQITRDVG